MQVGWLPVHAAQLVAEHCSHRPPAHTGIVAVGHASVALDPASPLHGLQVRVAGSQMEAEAGQSVFALHPQVLVATRQTGVLPRQAVPLVGEHGTH